MEETEAMKYGAEISKKNKAILRQIKELVSQFVDEPEAESPAGEVVEAPGNALIKSADDEMLVFYGSAVKSIDGKLTGYAVRFGGVDLTGDTFAHDTNYGFAGETAKRIDILLHHAQAMETKTGKRVKVTDPIGYATLKMADDGILIEDAILFNADKYQKMLDKLGWSTGAASHSVIRENGTIKQWQIAEVSLTPIPAEPRNMVAAKSLEGAIVEMDENDAEWLTPDRAETIAAKAASIVLAEIQQRRQNAG